MHRPNASLEGRTVLNLGSGRKPREDAINVDLVPGDLIYSVETGEPARHGLAVFAKMALVGIG